MPGPRIKIYARSFDLRLYRLSKGLYDKLRDAEGRTISCVRLTDRTADGYFFTMLRDTECDIAVNIDEDAFMVDPKAVLELAYKVWEDNYANAGYPDTITRGNGDPTITNPFFNILNLKLIRTRFNRSELVERPDDLEPYYPFLRWVVDNFKTLYLTPKTHPDGITTIALDEQGRTLCLHTWFSRFYSLSSWIVRIFQPTMGKQKSRIDAVIHEAYGLRGIPLPKFSFPDRMSFAGDKFIRWIIKVPQRISRWPWKLSRRLLRKRNG